MSKKVTIHCVSYSILLPIAILLLPWLPPSALKEGLIPFLLVLPAIPCGIMRLWVQKSRIATLPTIYICLLLPLILSVLLPLLANMLSTFPISYSGTLGEQIISLLTQNTLAALGVMLLTIVGRWISGLCR